MTGNYLRVLKYELKLDYERRLVQNTCGMLETCGHMADGRIITDIGTNNVSVSGNSSLSTSDVFKRKNNITVNGINATDTGPTGREVVTQTGIARVVATRTP